MCYNLKPLELDYEVTLYYVKIVESGLHFSVFNLIFLFFLFSFFYFLFLEQLGLGLEVIGHNIDHETWENGVEGSRTNDVIQYG